MGTSNTGIIFVYNADSGLFNTVSDIAHKIFSPDTYECALCSISHGYFHVRAEWKGFIETLPIPCEFLHRDEAIKKYHIADQLPAVFVRKPEGIQVCLTADEIQMCKSVKDLQQAVLQSCCQKEMQA